MADPAIPAGSLGPLATTIDDEDGFMPVSALRGSNVYITQGSSQLTMSCVVAERLARVIAPRQQPAPGEVERFVAGPVWQELEEEGECWTAEIQLVGGHYVVATVCGGTRDEAVTRQAAILAALADQPAAPGGWRDIASAPKDGTRVLLFAPTRAFAGAIIAGWYSSSGREWLSEPGMWQREPTHWMPLPAAPAQADREG